MRMKTAKINQLLQDQNYKVHIETYLDISESPQVLSCVRVDDESDPYEYEYEVQTKDNYLFRFKVIINQ